MLGSEIYGWYGNGSWVYTYLHSFSNAELAWVFGYVIVQHRALYSRPLQNRRKMAVDTGNWTYNFRILCKSSFKRFGKTNFDSSKFNPCCNAQYKHGRDIGIAWFISRPKWISVAKSKKLFKSATEKRDLKKHLSFSIAVCDQKQANGIPWPKVCVSIVV